MKRILSFLTLTLILLLSVQLINAQNYTGVIDNFLKSKQDKNQLETTDIQHYRITDQYTTRDGRLTNIYIQQTHYGIPVTSGRASIHLSAEGKIVHSNLHFESHLDEKVNNDVQSLSAEQAVRKAAANINVVLPTKLEITEQFPTSDQKTIFDRADFALEPVSASLVYFETKKEALKLCWEVIWYEKNADHYWNLKIDATTGEVLAKNDMVVHCSFGSPALAEGNDNLAYGDRSLNTCLKHGHHHDGNEQLSVVPNSYFVLPMPVESPSHGDHEVVVDPANAFASPFGWHDTDGVDGAEYTITRGNNVHAYQDENDLDASSGDEPDGGADLEFNFFYADTASALEIRDAAVVNLFYWCNIIHDVWYHYGFDEPSGNFQANNYGNGGQDGDHVNAEAQDGSGLNNANFATPPDGGNGRMQMYLWTNPNTDGVEAKVTVDKPGDIAGDYFTVPANFGPQLSAPLTGDIALVDDGSVNPTFACSPLTSGSEVQDKIALIDRGDCNFPDKITNAQNAGAIGAIVCNNVSGAPFAMGGGGGGITIPSFMISQEDCDLIKTQLDTGVQVTLSVTTTTAPDFLDGDFDNGIIAHEYAHGVSNRLTGGPSAADCLFNQEQMGEGWSDYWSLVMTMEEGDTGGDVRGIGTFALGEPTNGEGIRPAPYSTDLLVNDYTYANAGDGNISVPHGVGFIWCTMLWDMTWALIDEYGFDPDFYTGTGGNNIAMKLVLEGMRVQTCNPGFADGRDAILKADSMFFDAANQCLIWEAFARRGLGFSADQGSSDDRSDGVAAFDVAPFCTPVTEAPTANFGVGGDAVSCSGFFQFTDNSDQGHFWSWDFGDGGTSSKINPSHLYTEEGDYTVTLIVYNPLGQDTTTIDVSVDFLDAPSADDAIICGGNSASLEASGGTGYIWYENGEVAGVGSPFITPVLNSNTTYDVATTEIDGVPAFVGPSDNNFGSGGYHNTGFTGTVIFEAHEPVIIHSIWVDAGSAGPRTISLFDENQNILKSVEIDVPAGPSTAILNIEVEQAGTYQLGGTTINLYRNDNGANYPYEIDNLITLTGSPAGPDYYYYCYNWEVIPYGCKSPTVSVDVEVLPAPTADFSYTDAGEGMLSFTDQSTGAISWSWDFGDNETSTEQNPSHTYNQNGTYIISLTVSNGDCETTYEEEIDVVVVSTNNISGFEQLELRPNIGSGAFDLIMETTRPQAVEVVIFNTLGQQIQSRTIGAARSIQERFDIRSFETGTYFVKVKVGESAVVKRYVLIR